MHALLAYFIKLFTNVTFLTFYYNNLLELNQVYNSSENYSNCIKHFSMNKRSCFYNSNMETESLFDLVALTRHQHANFHVLIFRHTIFNLPPQVSKLSLH